MNIFFIGITAEIAENDVQTILIDCSSVIFVDVAGAKLFIQVHRVTLACFDYSLLLLN